MQSCFDVIGIRILTWMSSMHSCINSSDGTNGTCSEQTENDLVD